MVQRKRRDSSEGISASEIVVARIPNPTRRVTVEIIASTAEVACYGGRSARSDRLTFSTTAHASFNVLDFSELSNQ